MKDKKGGRLPIVTIFFVGINVLIWILSEFFGNTRDSLFMLKMGAAYPPFILENGEWYRLFTCMFLHFGAEHLMNNMLLLYLTGIHLEKALGSIRFAFLYLSSGLCGSLLSLYMERNASVPTVSAGASGAVFGIIGGLLAAAICNKGRIDGLGAKGLLGMAVLSLYYGLTTAGVDNWAHIGGFLGGFFTVILFFCFRLVSN